MGRSDAFEKAYLSRNDIFADVFNFFVYDGQKVISPDALKEESIDQQAVFSTGNVQRLRDVKKSAVIKHDDKTLYVLFAIEAQTKVNPTMPVRCMLYDALEYDAQVKAAKAIHKSQRGKGLASDEFIAGFSREDRLTPVVTLVVYFGSKRWDAPLSIHQMAGTEYDARLMRFAAEYKVNLIQPATLSEEDLARFASDFALVMKFLKIANDKKRVKELLEDESSPYTTISTSAALVINSCAGIGLKINEEKEETNMCQAIRELQEEAIESAIGKNVKSLMSTMNLTFDQATAALCLTDSEKAALKPLVQPL